MEDNHPIVFISYSWDSQEHQEWVLKLASDLRRHGVDAILDQWDARLGDDLPFFMEQGLTKAKLVLCVCSDVYVGKANAGNGGVGYEKRILSADLLTNENKSFIIPIVRNNSSNHKVPTFLLGIKYLDFDADEYFSAYMNLLERIYDEDIKKRPELGANPFKGNSISERISTKIDLEKINFENPNRHGIVSFDYKKNNGLFTIGTGSYSFLTQWSECGYDSIYCYRDRIYRIGYKASCSEFPMIEHFEQFDFSSRAKSIKVNEVVLLENSNHQFAAIKILKVHKAETDINHLLEFEYKIYDII